MRAAPLDSGAAHRYTEFMLQLSDRSQKSLRVRLAAALFAVAALICCPAAALADEESPSIDTSDVAIVLPADEAVADEASDATVGTPDGLAASDEPAMPADEAGEPEEPAANADETGGSGISDADVAGEIAPSTPADAGKGLGWGTGSESGKIISFDSAYTNKAAAAPTSCGLSNGSDRADGLETDQSLTIGNVEEISDGFSPEVAGDEAEAFVEPGLTASAVEQKAKTEDSAKEAVVEVASEPAPDEQAQEAPHDSLPVNEPCIDGEAQISPTPVASSSQTWAAEDFSTGCDACSEPEPAPASVPDPGVPDNRESGMPCTPPGAPSGIGEAPRAAASSSNIVFLAVPPGQESPETPAASIALRDRSSAKELPSHDGPIRCRSPSIA